MKTLNLLPFCLKIILAVVAVSILICTVLHATYFKSAKEDIKPYGTILHQTGNHPNTIGKSHKSCLNPKCSWGAAPNTVLSGRQAILRKSPNPRILDIQGIKDQDELAALALDPRQPAVKL